MPFQSEKQRRYLWANEPEVARKWAEKYNTGGSVMNGGLLKNNDVTVTMKSEGGETITYKSPKGMMPDNAIMGGLVNGKAPTPVADNKIIAVTPGEFVVNYPAAQKYKGLLNQINDEGKQMLAQGGWIEGYAGGGSVSDWERKRFIRKLLESVKPGSRDEKMLLKKLGIRPGGKAMGGMIEGYQTGGQIPEDLLREAAIESLTKGRGLIGRFFEPTEVEITEEMQRIKRAQAAAAAPPEDIPIIQGIENLTGTEIQSHDEGVYNRQYTPAHGQSWQNEVTVPAGADKYQGHPAYDLVSDDRFTGYRTYRLNPQWVEMQGGGRGVPGEGFGDRAAWQQSQQDAYNAQAQAQAGQITGQYPTRTQSMQDVAARDAEFAAAQAAGGQMRQDVEQAARDEALARATETARGETQQRFQYQSGESYNAPSKEVAESWVQAGIVAAGAMFTLPNGVTGRAQ